MNQHFNTMCREAPLCGLIQINMEQKTIPLNKGIVRNTSLATDGELIDCVNLMPKNGQMMNAPTLTETGETIGQWETLLYIHPTSVGDVYVVKYSSEGDIIIAYKKEGSNVEICTLPHNAELYEVKHIGNVLVVLTSERTAMFLYDDGEYIDYTFDFDNIDITFGLSGEVVKGEPKAVKFTGTKEADNGMFQFVKSWIPKDTNQIAIYPQDVEIEGNVFTNGESFRLKHYFFSATTNAWGVGLQKDGEIVKRYGGASGTSMRNDISFTMPEGIEAIVVSYKETPTGTFELQLYKGDGIGVAVDASSYNTVFGMANAFIQEKVVNKTRFAFPFFIRYAIELTDGSHIKPSAPCMMIPSTGVVPYIETSKVFSTSDYESGTCPCVPASIVCDLIYRINSHSNKDIIDILKSRSEIVKGISIAITSPIYQYNQGWNNADEFPLLFRSVSETYNDKSYILFDQDGYIPTPEEYKKSNLYGNYKPENLITLPTKPLLEEIEKSSIFRIIHSIPIEDLATSESFVQLTLKDGILKGLDGLPILEDNVSSRNKYIAKSSFVYNNRFHISNYKEIIPALSGVGYMNGYATSSNTPKVTSCFLRANIENNMVDYPLMVKSTATNPNPMWIYLNGNISSMAEIYYAVQEDIQGNTTKYYKKKLPFKKHPFLNGAYWFDNFKHIALDGDEISLDDYNAYKNIPDCIIDTPNKIKTSEVNNPFVMKQTTSLNDEVVALATATKALSEGQFGQFPLYAFCKDGIWALEPSSDGTYASKQPVSRDVCSNSKAITQTDNAVVFPTLQGLKVLQGGTTTNISNVMDGKAENTSFLKDVIAEFNDLCLEDNADFNEAIQDANIVYDYVNNLLHIYAKNASYIYNLSSGDWTRTDDQKPRAIVPGYPYSTIQVKTKLYRYEKPTANGTRKGMLLTRETAFDDPLTMKIIKDLRVMRRHGYAKVAVWVSNDRQNWGRLTSLRMHSYKWYRFAVFTELNNTDALEGIVARIESRKTNKMR